MANNENILQELHEISEAVAIISNRNVYHVPAGYFEALAEELFAGVQKVDLPLPQQDFTVPVGYFEGLAANIMQKIYDAQPTVMQNEVFGELASIAPLLNTIGKATPFSVPNGYFENFGSAVVKTLDGENIYDQPLLAKEEADAGYLFGLVGKKMPYNLPPGYFENFAGIMVNNIRQLENRGAAKSDVTDNLHEIAPMLAGIGNKNPYRVFPGYFDGLANIVACRIAVFVELEQLAPMLNGISKIGPYIVPETYFDHFTVNLTIQNQTAKVVPIHGTTTKWMVWLAAACITAVIATSGFLFWQKNVKQPVTIADFTYSISEVSDADISNYLNTMTTPGVETIPNSVLDEHVPEVEPVIQNLSSDEIKAYLDTNSDPNEKSQQGS